MSTKGQKGGEKTGGRKAGTPNKVTATVRATFEKVFNDLQNSRTANLKTWGERNTTEFYKLASKLIPTEINATVVKVGKDLEEDYEG